MKRGIVFLLFVVLFISGCGLQMSPNLNYDKVKSITSNNFRDLTESGTSLIFEDVVANKVKVDIVDNLEVDYLSFDIRGKKGDIVNLVFPSIGEDWIVRVWIGPGEWRTIPASYSRQGLNAELQFQLDRELVELLPPGFDTSRACDYSYSDFENFISLLEEMALTDSRLTVSIIGASLENRPIWKVVFDGSHDIIKPEWKPTVIMLFRQHGDEWQSSYVFEGMINKIMDPAYKSYKSVNRRVRWIFYPLVNPDGAESCNRYNSGGIDLNRNWDRYGPAQSFGQEPETYFIQSDIENLPFQETIRVISDIHGWQRPYDGGFRHMYTCESEDCVWDNFGLEVLTFPEYLESVEDTDTITLLEPMIYHWEENQGEQGMVRVEFYHWKGWIPHTPEYSSSRSENELRGFGTVMFDALSNTVYPFNMYPDELYLGKELFLQVNDHDQNMDSQQKEIVEVQIWDDSTKDFETILLEETGDDTGVFFNSLLIYGYSAVENDGFFQSKEGSTIYGYYLDSDFLKDYNYDGVKILHNIRPTNVLY